MFLALVWRDCGEEHHHVQMFNSYFFEKLVPSRVAHVPLAHGAIVYENVRRWTGKANVNVDIFTKRAVVFPIHVQQSHWCLVLVDMQQCTVTVFDSLGYGSTGQPTPEQRLWKAAVVSYLEAEDAMLRTCPSRGPVARARPAVDADGWARWGRDVRPPPSNPLQHNAFDCGVFVCALAHTLLSGKVPLARLWTSIPLQRACDMLHACPHAAALLHTTGRLQAHPLCRRTFPCTGSTCCTV